MLTSVRISPSSYEIRSQIFDFLSQMRVIVTFSTESLLKAEKYLEVLPCNGLRANWADLRVIE
jgi:hypothetical protein